MTARADDGAQRRAPIDPGPIGIDRTRIGSIHGPSIHRVNSRNRGRCTPPAP